MEFIPDARTSLKINDIPLEIMQIKNNMVKTVRVFPLPLDEVAETEQDLQH